MKRLLPIEPTEEMLDIIAGTRWCNLPLSKQAAEVEAYKKLVRLGDAQHVQFVHVHQVTADAGGDHTVLLQAAIDQAATYRDLMEENERLRKALQRIADNDPYKVSSAGIDARHALLPLTPPAPGVEPIGPMPDEIKVRFAARKRAHPNSVIWAMFDGKDWYVYAHTMRHAKARMKLFIEQGFHIYTEVSP